MEEATDEASRFSGWKKILFGLEIAGFRWLITVKRSVQSLTYAG